MCAKDIIVDGLETDERTLMIMHRALLKAEQAHRVCIDGLYHTGRCVSVLLAVKRTTSLLHSYRRRLHTACSI